MGKLFNPDSGFSRAMSRLTDLIVLNLITLVCSLPIITIGAATCALYDAVDGLRKDEGHIYRRYFSAFKTHFKRGTIQGLICGITGICLGIAMYFYYQSGVLILVFLTSVLVMVYAMISAWVFPLQVKMNLTIRETLKKALLCGIAFLPRTLAMVALNVLPLALLLIVPSLFVQLMGILLFVWFALVAYCVLTLMQKPFKTIGVETEEEVQ